jgi:hypothetical protein
MSLKLVAMGRVNSVLQRRNTTNDKEVEEKLKINCLIAGANVCGLALALACLLVTHHESFIHMERLFMKLFVYQEIVIAFFSIKMCSAPMCR